MAIRKVISRSIEDNTVAAADFQGAVTSLSNAGNLTFSSTGQRILGDMSNATVANRVIFQSSTTNGATNLELIPNGTSTATFFVAESSSSDPSNGSSTYMSCTGTESQLVAHKRGTGTYLPLTMLTGGSERLRIGTGGNIGIGATDNANIKLLVKQAVDSDVGGIGFQSVDGTATAVISELNSGALVTRNGGAERMRIDSSGNLLLNTTTVLNSAKMTLNYAGSSTNGITVNDTSSTNGSAFVSFYTGGTFRGFITNNNNSKKTTKSMQMIKQSNQHKVILQILTFKSAYHPSTNQMPSKTVR
jgi:hypothetical protein